MLRCSLAPIACPCCTIPREPRAFVDEATPCTDTARSHSHSHSHNRSHSHSHTHNTNTPCYEPLVQKAHIAHLAIG